MGSENIQVTTSKEDWDDFFAQWDDPQDALDSMDSYSDRVRVACELSNRQVQTPDKRLDATTPQEIGAEAKFKFDR